MPATYHVNVCRSEGLQYKLISEGTWNPGSDPVLDPLVLQAILDGFAAITPSQTDVSGTHTIAVGSAIYQISWRRCDRALEKPGTEISEPASLKTS